MSDLVLDEGVEALLTKAFNGTGNLTLKLFTNTITIDSTKINADFTEAAGGGYAAKTLTAGSFTVSSPGGIPQATYAQQTFTFTGVLTTNPTIKGYYIVDAGNKVWAAGDLTAFTPTNNGDFIKVTPTYQHGNGTPV